MTKTTKIMKSQYEKVDRSKEYTLNDAVKLIVANAKTRKFDETVEVVMNLGVDPKHADQAVRGVIELPHGTGATVRVAVFARDAKADEAKAAGADIVGAEDLADKIKAGEMDFDRCIATPDMMAVVGQLGKILGPKGMMPNPKLGTVTPDVAKAVESAKGGAIEYRAEKAGIVQAGVGKLSFGEKKVAENVSAFIKEIIRVKPSGAKGSYVKKVTLTSSMGPGIKVSVDSIYEAQQAA